MESKRIQLPKPLEEYFQYSVDDRTGDYLRYHLRFFYNDDGRIERRHWTWTIPDTQAALHEKDGEDAAELYRAQRTKRAEDDIVRWLEQKNKVLTGSGEIPEIRTDTPAPVI